MEVFTERISRLFVYVLNTSLNGALAILAVAALRRLLYKAPKSFRPRLWGIAALRLVFPATFGFLVGLMNISSNATAFVTAGNGRFYNINLFPSGEVRLITPPTSAPGASLSALYINALSVLYIAATVWFVGLLLLLAYSAAKYRVLKRNLKEAVPYPADFEFTKGIRVYTSDKISSPFVAGLKRPVIYLPKNTPGENAEYILCHEAMHIKRKDHIFKFIAFLILRLHWFNPFVWAAFSLFCSDVEMACDEKTISYLGENSKKNYSLALLSMATANNYKSSMPLYFAEGSVKSRVKNILSYKKPNPAAFVLAGVAAVCLGFWVYTHPVTVMEKAGNDYHKEGTVIEFPAYQDGRNDYNSRIYDITPFSFGITLPQGRYFRDPEDKVVGAPWTSVLIQNSADEQIGTVGFGIFEDVPELSQDEIYKAAFRELRLSSRVLWLEDYTPIYTDEFCQKATSKTLVSDAYLNPDNYRGNTPEAGFTEYPTATIFDRSKGVYVVAIFAPGSMTEQDLSATARSMTIGSATE